MKKLLTLESNISAEQFRWFRIIFGAYLCWHFSTLIPYAGEIFSLTGIMGTEGINPFRGKWINPIHHWGTPLFVEVFITIGIIASILFIFGQWQRSSAIFLWFLHSCLYTANPLISNPSLGYIGMLLLLCASVPRNFNQLPGWIPLTAWCLLATGYTFSGILKLSSPSWVDGSALIHLMNNPLARPGLIRDIMLSIPNDMMTCLTWSILLLEVLFIPLVYLRSTRSFAWLAMLMIHVGIMLSVDFADLSMGMIMVHLFIFNKSWLLGLGQFWSQGAMTILNVSRKIKKQALFYNK